MWYGGLSGGTRPRTSSMTKNGAPSTDGSVSYQRTFGTGIDVDWSARSTLVLRLERSVREERVAAGRDPDDKVDACCPRPPDAQDASTISVSFEKPVAPGPRNSLSVTSPSASTFGASQAASADRVCSASRWAGIGIVGT